MVGLGSPGPAERFLTHLGLQNWPLAVAVVEVKHVKVRERKKGVDCRLHAQSLTVHAWSKRRIPALSGRWRPPVWLT